MLEVSEKGGLSVYGLGRFPVTLYQEPTIASDIRPRTAVRHSHCRDHRKMLG